MAKTKLQELADLYNYRNLLESDRKLLRDKVLAPVMADLIEIDEEIDEKIAPLNEKIAQLEEEMKQYAAELGGKYQEDGVGCYVWYAKGSPKWDDKKLIQWLQKHPDFAYEIMQFRSESKPKISVRESHGKELED